MRELSLHLLDVAQNSIAAGASLVQLRAEERSARQTLLLEVTDNGRGMDAEALARACDPFYTTRATRDVGLGLPLFRMACEQTGGVFHIGSAPGGGTAVRALFRTGHIDMPPLGAMDETVALLVHGNPRVDVVYTRLLDGGSFTLDTRGLRKDPDGEERLARPGAYAWLRAFLREHEQALQQNGNVD